MVGAGFDIRAWHFLNLNKIVMQSIYVNKTWKMKTMLGTQTRWLSGTKPFWRANCWKNSTTTSQSLTRFLIFTLKSHTLILLGGSPSSSWYCDSSVAMSKGGNIMMAGDRWRGRRDGLLQGLRVLRQDRLQGRRLRDGWAQRRLQGCSVLFKDCQVLQKSERK